MRFVKERSGLPVDYPLTYIFNISVDDDGSLLCRPSSQAANDFELGFGEFLIMPDDTGFRSLDDMTTTVKGLQSCRRWEPIGTQYGRVRR